MNYFKTKQRNYKKYLEGKSEYNLVGVEVIEQPTHNCQSCCIGSFDTILDTTGYDKKQIFEIFKEIHTKLQSNIAIIDVNDYYIHDVDKLFKGRIITKARYTSTNSSDMCIYLINLTKI